jgi:pyocin large subunit-like protein
MKLTSVAVMARLADWCNDSGVCWPSVETIARQTGAGISTVRKAIAQLEDDGWLTRKQRRKGNRNASNVYQLNVGKLYAAAAPHQAKSDAPQSDASESGWSKNNEKEGFHHPEFDGSEYDASNSDPSKNAKKDGFHPPRSGGDPSVNSTTDPSVNLTHIARGEEVEPVSNNPIPDYPGQPGIIFPAAQLNGKFQMHTDWTPSPDFRRQAALWGKPLQDGLNLPAELASFIAYWASEGKVFTQTQWELKFASNLQGAKPTQPRGNTHAGLDPNSTANPAVQKIRAARSQWERERAERMGVLGAGGGDLLEPVDGQKRLGPVGPMDCADWEFDQRPDDERL